MTAWQVSAASPVWQCQVVCCGTVECSTHRHCTTLILLPCIWQKTERHPFALAIQFVLAVHFEQSLLPLHLGACQVANCHHDSTVIFVAKLSIPLWLPLLTCCWTSPCRCGFSKTGNGAIHAAGWQARASSCRSWGSGQLRDTGGKGVGFCVFTAMKLSLLWPLLQLPLYAF